jgi:hypothetical protein
MDGRGVRGRIIKAHPSYIMYITCERVKSVRPLVLYVTSYTGELYSTSTKCSQFRDANTFSTLFVTELHPRI